MDYTSDRSTLLKEIPPTFRNMQFENIRADGAPTAILITGMAASPIQNIRFENLTVTSTRGVVASDARGLTFKNVQVKPAKGPVFDLSNASDILVEGSAAPPGTDIFMSLSGTSSSHVRIVGGDLSAAKKPFTASPEVAADAVVVK